MLLSHSSMDSEFNLCEVLHVLSVYSRVSSGFTIYFPPPRNMLFCRRAAANCLVVSHLGRLSATSRWTLCQLWLGPGWSDYWREMCMNECFLVFEKNEQLLISVKAWALSLILWSLTRMRALVEGFCCKMLIFASLQIFLLWSGWLFVVSILLKPLSMAQTSIKVLTFLQRQPYFELKHAIS